MEAFVGLFALALLVAVVAGVVAFTTSAKKRSAAKIDPNWQPPRADPLPYARRNYFFSAGERSFYEVLRRLTPDYTVFAKVRLADLVYITRGTTSRQSHLNRIDRKHIDFVLCDEHLAPVVAIELDDSSHERANRRSRDEFVDTVLAAASIPFLHVTAKRGYVLEELRSLLAPHLRIAGPPPTP